MIDPEAMRMVDAMRFDSHKKLLKQASTELQTLAGTLQWFESDRAKQVPRSGIVSEKMESLSGLLTEARNLLRDLDQLVEKGHTI